LAGTFHWSEDPSAACWYFPPQKIPLAENRFLQVGKGAESTKEKIQAVLCDLMNIGKNQILTILKLAQRFLIANFKSINERTIGVWDNLLVQDNGYKIVVAIPFIMLLYHILCSQFPSYKLYK